MEKFKDVRDISNLPVEFFELSCGRWKVSLERRILFHRIVRFLMSKNHETIFRVNLI